MSIKQILKSVQFQVLWLTLPLCFSPVSVFAVTPAGTIVFSQAKASYFDIETGMGTEAVSNSVVLSVQQVYGLAIELSSDLQSPPGQFIQFSHRIINTGNGVDTMLLSLSVSGTLTPLTFDIFEDTNGNGRLDPGEDIKITDLKKMDMGESRAIVIAAQLSPAAQIGQKATFLMTVQSLGDSTKMASVTDSVEIHGDAQIQSYLSAVPTSQVGSGDVIQYLLTATNKGLRDANPVMTLVMLQSVSGTGGLPTDISGVLMTHPLPANTLFEEAVIRAPEEALLVYEIGGQWMDSFNPNDKGQVSGVGAILLANGGSLLPAQVAALAMKVRVLAQVSQATLASEGRVTYQDNSPQANTVVGISNLVTHSLIGSPESAYFVDESGIKTTYFHSGQIIYIAVTASSMNQDAAVIEVGGVVIVTSQASGDKEAVTIIETGANTGVFRGSIVSEETPLIALGKPAWRSYSKLQSGQRSKPVAVIGDGILDIPQNSALQLSYTNPLQNTTLISDVLIDPTGIVFDSVAKTPLSGILVTLVDAISGSVVVIPGGGKNPITTGTNGHFSFEAPNGEYRLIVEGIPAGFTFPSVLPSHNVTSGGREIHLTGSYGKPFMATAAVPFDVPVDPPHPALLVQKVANKSDVEIGDQITYTVKVMNPSALLPILDIQLIDQPPAGIIYKPGSIQCAYTGLAFQPIADPISNGPMVFHPTCSAPVPNRLGVGEEMTLTYQAVVGPGAMIGDGVNRARATGRSMLGPANSNEVAAGVKIVPGVFTDRATLIGKVFIDLNGNGDQNEGESGVPAVRLILEDGTSAITDEDGKYSLYGLKPTTHVLKIDPITLPLAFLLTDSATRFAGDPKSRFIDLTHGELHKANFTIAALPQAIWEPIIKERKSLVGGKGEKIEEAAPSSSKTSAGQTTEKISLKTVVEGASPNLTIVSPLDLSILRIRSTNIIVTGHSGINFKLRVNDQLVSDHHVGAIVVSNDKPVAGIEWIAVSLEVGKNRIEVEGFDEFGNLRQSQVITVLVPGKVGNVKITADPKEIPADGITPSTISISISDSSGLPVLTREFLTVKTSHGRLVGADLDPNLPDHQIAVSEGKATLKLIPSGNVEDAIVAVKGMDGVSDWGQAKVSFLPALREMVAVGILDGTINLQNFKGNVMPVTPDDQFSESLTTDGRAAFYLKGRVSGSSLLTLAYDSDKDKKERLFRDIQPEEFYPIYGDASVKGFDAQSTGRLYVKIEKGKGYLLFGDFSPDFTGNDLAAYQRALNGLKYHYEDETRALTAFHNRSRQKQIVERIRGNGTSGFYQISQFPIVENSDQVEIITVDRERPEIVITSETKSRFVDYTLDTGTGQILFRAPVPSFDANFNPVFIKIFYETRGQGVSFDTYGVNSKIKLTNRIQIGGTLVQSEEPQNQYTLYGSDLRLKLSDAIMTSWEIAESKARESGVSMKGFGWKGTLSIKPHKMIAADLYRIETDPSFKNPSSNIAGGKIEQGITTRILPREGTVLSANAIESKDEIAETSRLTTDVKVEQAFGNAKGEVAFKHIEDQTPTKNQDTDTARVKIVTPFPGLPKLTTSLEYEQVLQGDSNIITLGNDYQMTKNTKLRSKQEWISGGPTIPGGAEAGRNGIGRTGRRSLTTVGIDSTVYEGTTAFSEYRIAQSIEGREDQAAIGLRNRFAIKKGVTLSSSFERTETIEGPETGDSTAFAIGLEHLASSDLKGTTRFEMRRADLLTSFLGTAAIAYKVNPNISFLGRETFFLEDGKKETKDKLSSLFTFGVAVRPVATDQIHLLFKSEFKYNSEGADSQSVGTIERIFAGSIDANIRVLPRTSLFLKYANRMVREDGDLHSTTQMVASRVTYDLTSKIDLGFEGRHFWNDRSASKVWGYGIEGGYRLATNLWLSIGYQVNGYDQESFTEEQALTQGVFVRLRYKFDEHLADFLKGGPMKPQEIRPIAKEPIVVSAPVPIPAPIVVPKPTVLIPPPVIPPAPGLVPVPMPEAGVSYEKVLPPPPITIIDEMNPRVYFEFTDANFKFDSARLTPKGKTKVAQYAQFLKENSDLDVTIEGHADRRGPKEYNQRLGLSRAKAVWKALKSHKVKNKMEVISFGESQPKDRARTKSAHAKNRRVQLRVTESNTQEKP
ncbi:MAG: OmpA family protein [Nitrospirota bacterium]